MKIYATVFFAVLVTQSSASLFDTIRGAFQPLGNCVGKLYNDVVSDLRQTIDCTVMAVEHAFSWKTMFGRNAEYYEEMCTGRKKNASKLFNDAYNVASQDISAREQALNQLENTIENSPADVKEKNTIEEALFNETLRLQQIHKIICEELSKLTDDDEKRMTTLDHDLPSAETVLDEVKRLYEIEQLNRTSSRANEVRNTFDKVLSLLQVNDTGGVYSDDEEVKVIMKGIGKSLGNAVDDVEKKFMEWKQENNKLLLSLSKNISLEHNDDEVSSKPDKDGSKLKRQSASFDVSALDSSSRVGSQNNSDLIHSMESKLIPILNPSNYQFPKIDQKNENAQSADKTKESIQSSSKVTHHNSTENGELSRQTSLLTNQSEINQDAINLRRLLPNNFENLEQRENSLKLADKIWNPGNQNQTKQKDSNAPEYTQLTLKGIQFQKAADILKSSHENQLKNKNGLSNESPKTVRQSTAEKSQDMSRNFDIKQGGDRFGDLPKDPSKAIGQLIQKYDASISPEISKQTNIMITNKVLENNQNQTANLTKDSHSTKASNEKTESEYRPIESNLRLDSSKENKSEKTSQVILKMDNKLLEDHLKPVKELNDFQSKIIKSSLSNLQLNMSAAIADHSELKQETTPTVNHSSQLEGANKTMFVKLNSQPSNDKHNLDTKQSCIPIFSTQNNTEVIADNNQRSNIDNKQYKNQTNSTKLVNHAITTQDDSNLNNSTCLNKNPEILQESSHSLNVTEKLNLAQERNETVNTPNSTEFIQNNSQILPPINKILLENSKPLNKENKPESKKENIHTDDSAQNYDLVLEEQKYQLSSLKHKPHHTELKQQSGLNEPAVKTPESTHGNIQLSIKKKPDNISDNDQTVAIPDCNHNRHAPLSSEVNLEVRLECNQNMVTKNNSEFLHKEILSLVSSALKTPIQNSSEPLNSDTNTELNKSNSMAHGIGNYSEATQEMTQPLNASINTDFIKGKNQSLSHQKPEPAEILEKSEENPIGNNKPLSQKNESDMITEASSTAENNEEKKQQNNEFLISLHNPKTENISKSAKLERKNNQHTNVQEKFDLIPERIQPSSVDNYIQTNGGFSASENLNMTHESKLINTKNKKCCEPVILAVSQEDNQAVSIEKKEQNDKTDIVKEMIPESINFENSEFIVVQEEGKKDQYKNEKNSEFLNKNLTTEFVQVENLPNSLANSSMEETLLDTYNSSECTKSRQQSSQVIQNVFENITDLTDSVSDDKYKSQYNQDDTKLASAGINLSSKIGTKENKTLESPQQEVLPSSNIPQMMKENTNSSNKPASQITHSNGNNKSLDENLQLPQNNAAVVSQQLRENLQTVAESTQLTQETYGPEVVQMQVPSENRIEYSTVSSIDNSSEDEHVASPTFNTFEGQMIEGDSYVPSPRFSHVLNQQTTLLETEPDSVRDSKYSNQDQYVPNPKFNCAFDQSTHPTESSPDLSAEWQEGTDDTLSEIRSTINEDKEEEPLWSSFNKDYFSTNYMRTEKPESYGFFTESMLDIESIIQDSQRSESLMENLFSNMDHEHNVFEEPDMLYN